ncbi:hypothetical protein AYL99_10392 [Fonsecaea erecta]|uniref:Uncharacterized protein n=1 Tax=Fonsecaea erecta TaxID=1367422 RepID=A0A178Z6M3_9EURO|nr:hypothetical protein AYL99_10392 [Fonsecaea erecta]OAP55419.1 hypothetical protein AYL99_10392 [Fonsecaea erecta]
MSSLPDQRMMKVTVVATQELCIRVDDPAVLESLTESIPHMVLEQLAHRGLNLTSIQVASNPGNLGGLPAGHELASAAIKDSAVFHMFNHNRAFPAWNRLPANMPNTIPLWDSEKTSVARQLDSPTQTPITWFYDHIPQAEPTELWHLGNRHRRALSASFTDHLIAEDDDQVITGDGALRPAQVSSLDSSPVLPEPIEEITSKFPGVYSRAKGYGRRKKARLLLQQAPKSATKPRDRARTRTQKEAATNVEGENNNNNNSTNDNTNRSGKGKLVQTEKRMLARIQDSQHFATRLERIDITKALDAYGHKRDRDLQKRLNRAMERRWRGQPSDMTEDDKVDVITQQLQKAI